MYIMFHRELVVIIITMVSWHLICFITLWCPLVLECHVALTACHTMRTNISHRPA